MIAKLKKELVDPTAKRMQLEVTINEKERAFAKATLPPPKPTKAHTALPPPAVMKTGIAAKPKPAQKPEQVASTLDDSSRRQWLPWPPPRYWRSMPCPARAARRS